MRLILLTLSLLLLTGSAWADSDTVIDPKKLCQAIYQAEGGAKASVPYGILSVKVKDKAEAKQVCLNTINNTIPRWQWARQHGDSRDFITYLGSRYAPTNGATNDPKNLNSNWVKNVKSIYATS